MMKLTDVENATLAAQRAEEEGIQATNHLSQYLSRLACILLVLGTLFFIPSSTTKANGNTLFIYNHTSNPVAVAYSYYNANCPCWYTAGWRHVQPGENKAMFNMGNQRTFFFYAVDLYNGGTWGATDHYRQITNQRFEVSERYIQSYGTAELRSQGFYQAPFTRIYAPTTGENVVWHLWP